MDSFIAVGDIHGCPQPLLEILETAQQYPSHRLIFLGDYIDRDPDPSEVISILSNLNGVFLKGNHEQALIDVIDSCDNSEMAARFLEAKGITHKGFEWIRNHLEPFYSTSADTAGFRLFLFPCWIESGLPSFRANGR